MVKPRRDTTDQEDITVERQPFGCQQKSGLHSLNMSGEPGLRDVPK